MGNITGCITIDQGYFGILETFGRYSRNLSPGFHCIIPCCQSVRYRYDLRQTQHKTYVETKTHDNVFCVAEIAIFYSLQQAEIQSFAYEITDFKSMVDSIVQDQVRSILCKVTLDESFETKQEITSIIKEALTRNFSQFGIKFQSVIVNDIVPDPKVRDAMNEIYRQDRLRIAVESEAEAQKIQLVKNAEAEAQAKKLSGVGLADQRKAIVDGLTTSIANFVENVDIHPQQVMQIIMMNQYFDTLKELSANHKSNCVFLPNNPGSSAEMNSQMMSSSLLGANSGQEQQHQLQHQLQQHVQREVEQHHPSVTQLKINPFR